MAFRFGHSSTVPLSAARVNDVESLAYTLLETARIRCEQLAPGVGPSALHDIHRNLGLAGYYTSAAFDPEQRLDCLALAHEECSANPLPDQRVAVGTIFDEAAGAADALANVLTALQAPGQPEIGDTARHLAHVHAAQLHLLSASEALDAMRS